MPSPATALEKALVLVATRAHFCHRLDRLSLTPLRKREPKSTSDQRFVPVANVANAFTPLPASERFFEREAFGNGFVEFGRLESEPGDSAKISFFGSGE